MIDFDIQRTKDWKNGTYNMPFGKSTITKGREGQGDPDWDVSAYDMILVNETKDFIENHLEGEDDKPFFAYVAFGGVHTPHNPPIEYIDGSPVENEYQTRHLDMLGLVDKAVGSLMEIIEENGLKEDTIILFSSDNGGLGEKHGSDNVGHSGSGPLRESKGSVYDGGHRVPLIISQPGTFGLGERRDQVVGLNDIYATICKLAGIEPSDNAALDSISFAEHIKDANKRSKRETLGTFKLSGRGKNWGHALRKGQYKLVHHPYNNTFEMYNMKFDIGETSNMLEVDPADLIVNKAVQFCKTLRRIGPCPIDGTRFTQECKKKCMSYDRDHYCDISNNGILAPGITYNEITKQCEQ
jgi:arylsulfatase A-like enzyme